MTILPTTPTTGPVLLKIGGTALENQRQLPQLWQTIASLHAAEPGGVVLVHGGGKAVDRHVDKLGFTTQRREGIRITPPDQLDAIIGMLCGTINKAIVSALARASAKGVGLSLADARCIPAVKADTFAFDPGRVGRVVPPGADADAPLLRLLLAHRYLPVLSSIGIDAEGECLNLNADDAAAGVAMYLGARAAIFMTDVAGILDASGRVLPEISPGAVQGLIDAGTITEGMAVKVRAAGRAFEALGTPTWIMSGNDPTSLADWARGRPVGTRFVATNPPSKGHATP